MVIKENFFQRFKESFLLLMMAALILPAVANAAAPINVAGVYEYDGKPNGVRKQMYLTLDFINGTPDFTQVFSGKESSFKRLPKDFMNAKKLTKNFSGSSAPGFGKYREKFLFSNTEEFKLTNPRLDNGLIVVDWTNAAGDKGECRIAVGADRRLRIMGLTKLTRDFSPDEIDLELVEDRLPLGVEPFVSPADAYAYLVSECEKSMVTPKVQTFDPEIPTEVVWAEQNGNSIEVKLKMKNKSNYDVLDIVVADSWTDQTSAEIKDGGVLNKYRVKAPGTIGDKPAVRAKKGEWVNFSIIFEGVDGKVDYLRSLKFDNNIAGGFFQDNRITTIENLPVHQKR